MTSSTTRALNPRWIIDRRRLLLGATLAGGAAAWMPAWAARISPGITGEPTVLSGEEITLRIARQTMRIDGRPSRAVGINGSAPAPLIRLREGQKVRLRVINDLDEDSSIHWHGLLVPAQFDGVPGISFPGIRARSTFVYEFPIRQAGTYWYHSHSGFQEQLGLYGPLVIDPAGAERAPFDREHVILLSDHSHEAPEAIFRHLKLMPEYYNREQQTLSGLLTGKDQPLAERLKWGGMRMEPTDIADVTGAAYTYLVNGHGPQDNWTGLFEPGERVRLRIINASSMTTFNLRIPGLPMTVVQADGQDVHPVEVDEFQIGIAETYDAIVTPPDDRAYTLIAESIDRSGMARATLAPRAGMTAEVPPLRKRPLLSMADMGMGSMDGDMSDMGGMDMSMRNFAHAPQVKRGPGVQTLAPMPVDRTGDPGVGLADAGHRVLTYRDLMAFDRNPDTRAPSRSIEIHLTGNMERFMWSFDGKAMSDTMEPIPFTQGERVRVTLINDTMMGHPIHLHGHFFELVTGHGDHAPRKHTVLVQPGGTLSFDLTADAPGDWAFHCHLLYHMTAGMMRVVSVRSSGDAA
ncbi:copper resistance system multicopper oxidase [Sphingomonas sp. PR090111-T3T-6A]|uniref:copper resistance system multicopper oxidase n=1 Tax=Sphingomonas sp. PR090111-T3T-6A TaxID=685778 RepID=UPI00036226DC|nr:copper resistance system multicopper oxidase [Sphingomonas sp. PR090111-T3T-6A]